MKITRMYTGKDGESHFEDTDIPLGSHDNPDRRSELIKATGIIFRETGADYDLDFHNAPRRQFVINLEGSVELILSDGSSRILGPGDILLAEDTTGRGHISRAVNNQPRKSIFVTLD
ncbi:hypothetical protein ACFLXY_08255 [Chloroflexota bacterium]